MRSIFSVMIFVIGFTAPTRAQLPDTRQEDRIVKLEQELVRLKETLFHNDSLYYTKAYDNGLEGLYVFDKLNTEATRFANTTSQSALMLKLMNVNNPASLELRRKIMTDLQQLIEKKIGDLNLQDTGRKRGLFAVVRNIFSNPLVSSAAQLLPLGTPVMHILSAVSAVVAPKTRVEKNALGAVKNVWVDVEAMLDNSPLKEIGDKIMPYLNFYDTLQVMNHAFNTEVEYIRQQARSIQKFVNSQKPQMESLTGWQPAQSFNLLIGKFNNRYTAPSALRTREGELAQLRLETETLSTLATRIIDQYERLDQLTRTYESLFLSFRDKYVGVMRHYAGQNNLFKQYLEPVIAQLVPAEQNNDTLVSPMVSPLARAVPPAANDEQSRRLQELDRKYRYGLETTAAEAIQKVIF